MPLSACNGIVARHKERPQPARGARLRRRMATFGFPSDHTQERGIEMSSSTLLRTTSSLTILPRSWAPMLLSVLRIMTGLLFLEHGTGKILGFPAGLPFLDKMPTAMLYFTGLMELIGGALITIGLFTRPAAFVLAGYMAVGYFMVHFPDRKSVV